LFGKSTCRDRLKRFSEMSKKYYLLSILEKSLDRTTGRSRQIQFRICILEHIPLLKNKNFCYPL
jgi:hypothetical protein